MTCTTAASSRSLSACTGSRRISPARAGSRLDRERWEHAALSTRRNPSLSGVIDEECSFVALLPEEVSQRKHDLREVAVHFPVCLLLFFINSSSLLPRYLAEAPADGFSDRFGDADGAFEKASGSCIIRGSR